MGDYTEILRHTDLILYDVKHVTESGYLDMTGQPMDQTQAFLGEAQRLVFRFGFAMSWCRGSRTAARTWPS